MDWYTQHIRWDKQSKDSSGSMPLGGHNAGCNVWVENNELCVYLAQSGAFDENDTLLKLGRLRIGFKDAPVLERDFSQELVLEDGFIALKAYGAEMRLWCDVHAPLLHVDYTGKAHELYVKYDCWRYRRRDVPDHERGQCKDYQYWPGEVTTYEDTVDAKNEEILFYHRNRPDKLVYDVVIRQQNLEDIEEHFPNWLMNRTMGGVLRAKGMHFTGSEQTEYQGVDQMTYTLASLQPVSNQKISVAMYTEQTDSLESWREDIYSILEKESNFFETKKWWNAYFSKSFIEIEAGHENNPAWQAGRNYQLFRYMLGCNYYGSWPTKFNGGLFTFDEGKTPDYRNWSGGIHTTQNQRLVYWPMLKNGDFEAMKPHFDFYKNITNAGKARVRKFYGHDGACFNEQLSHFGTSCGSDYNWQRRDIKDDAVDDSPWIRYLHSNALEVALMMLEYAKYTGDSIEAYLDFIENVVIFYDEHYPLDEKGKLYIFPSTALETFKCDPYSEVGTEYGAANPADAIAGLQAVLNGLIAYLPSGEKRLKYEQILERCPQLPLGERDGHPVFLPAEKYWPKCFNHELPQLYRVYPYNMNGLSEEEKRLGVNTWLYTSHDDDHDGQRDFISWQQGGIFAARLGLTETAAEYLIKKMRDSEKRFPAFWGPGHDWTPDHNWGGSGMIGLQEMLMQCYDDKILLFPAWPKEWDVRFKLYAPYKTVVEAECRNGAMRLISVTPSERRKDVQFN